MKKHMKHLWVAFLALLGLSSCKSQQAPAAPGESASKAKEEQSGQPVRDDGEQLDPDPHNRMICLYGPPPAMYRELEKEDKPGRQSQEK